MTPNKNELEELRQENAALRGCIASVIQRLADYDGYSKAEDLKKLIDGTCETLTTAYPERLVNTENQEVCPLCLQTYRSGTVEIGQDHTYVMKLKIAELNGFNMIGAIASHPKTYPISLNVIKTVHQKTGQPLGYLVYSMGAAVELLQTATRVAMENGNVPVAEFRNQDLE
jgi:hypothetical protein